MNTFEFKYRFFILILLLVFVLPIGCVSIVRPTDEPSGGGDSDDETGILFEQGEGFYKSRFYEKALQRYMAVVERSPQSKYAAPSLYKIGGIYMKNASYEKAVLFFDRLSAEYPRSPYAVEAFYNKGYCYLKVGDPQGAKSALQDYLVRGDALNKDKARIYLAQAETALGDYAKALVYYSAASSGDIDKNDQVEVLSEVKTVVDKHATEKQLKQALENIENSHVSDYVHYRLALIAITRDERSAAMKNLKAVDFGRAKFSFYREIKTLLNDLAGQSPASKDIGGGKTYTIGVLLPLTGKYAVFGEQVLHGIMLGVDFFSPGNPEGVNIEVIVKDTQGDPQVAVSAINDLASNPKVVAIIGPLMGVVAEAAAKEAQTLEIPIVTLTTHEEIADIGSWVFRNSVTLSMQVKSLIHYAHNQKGCRRFAVLYPKNKLGQTYAKLFSRYIDPTKNDITASVSYDDDVADFRAQVRAVKAGGNFDALFIPDNADKIALIAPQLVYFGIKDKVLLGTPSWNDDILAKKAKGYLDDTVIVDTLFEGSRKPNVIAFTSAYKQDFGVEPTLLAGNGYDTINIFGHLFKKGLGEGRATLRSGLMNVRDFPAVAGDTTILENGDTAKDLPLLRVGENGIEELF